MSQQRALTVRKANHDLGCISQSAASTSREAILLQPRATLPQKAESRNRTKQLCHQRTETVPFQLPSRWEPGGPAGVQGPQPARDSQELHGTTFVCLEGLSLYLTPALLSLKPRLLPASSHPRGTCSFLNCWFLLLFQSLSAALSLSQPWELIFSSANLQESQHYHLKLVFDA